MPQGLCNTPATFQRLMDYVLSDLKFSCVLFYLDNINVFSRTFTDHIDHLKEVFKRLLAAGLKLKLKKSSFFKEQIDYLGFIINKMGLQPQPSKIEAITKMQRPTNKRDIQVFLGMIGYYRQFIFLFSVTAQPLFELLKLDVKFTWSSQCESAFIALKNKMIEHPILVYPNFEKVLLCKLTLAFMQLVVFYLAR